MPYCIMHGCNNRTGANERKNLEQLEEEAKHNKKFSFHLFPRDIERREKWLAAINLQNLDVPISAAICSAHFREEDYVIEHSLRKLKKDAIPRLSEKESRINREKKNREEDIEMKSVENIESYIKEHQFTKNYGGILLEENKENVMNATQMDRSTSISPERIFNSPAKSQLRQNYAYKMNIMKRKLYQNNSSRKKLQVKIKSLESLVKNLIEEPDNKVFPENLDEGMKEVIKPCNVQPN